MQPLNVIPTALPFRGALMRATWKQARLWGLVPAVGGEFAGVATSRIYTIAAGKQLVINAATYRGGVLRAALLHAQNSTEIPGFGISDCVGFVGDETAAVLAWRGGGTAPSAVGGVKVTVQLQRARLYSLVWV
jgi:hypothetical protein